MVPGVSVEAAGAALEPPSADGPVDAANGRDGTQFERLFRLYYRRVVTFLAGYVSDRHLVHDLAQETLLRAYSRGLHREAEGYQWPWLAKVARNLATDAARRAQVTHEVSTDPVNPEPAHDGAEDALMAAALRAGVAEILGSVPAHQARILVARYIEDAGYEDIATREAMSVEAVRSSLFRARRTIRRRLQRLAAGRDLAALVPVLLGAWRARFRGLRARLRELASASAPLESLATAGMNGMATGAALGALTVATTLLPGTFSVGDEAGAEMSLPRAVETVAFEAAASANSAGEGTADPSRPVAGIEPDKGGGSSLDPVGHRSFRVDPVRTEEMGPAQKAPARGGADVGKDDDHTGLSYDREVDADVDGDGHGNLEGGGQGGAGLDCRPEGRQSAAALACPTLEQAPGF